MSVPKNVPEKTEVVKLTITLTNKRDGTNPIVDAKLRHHCKNKDIALKLISDFIKRCKTKKGDA